jgi:hypothetical protein
MTLEPSSGMVDLAGDAAAYQAGYQRTMREYQWVRAHGWEPTERQLVIALTQAMRIYSTARGGKPIGGQRPDWLRGRADALRKLLQQGAGAEL